MTCVVHLFRADLRTHDHPALRTSVADAQRRGLPWLALWVPPRHEEAPWGFARASSRRLAWWWSAALGLAQSLAAHGHRLWTLNAHGPAVWAARLAAMRPAAVHTEGLPAPEEEAFLQALRQAGLPVQCHGHGTLLDAADLPFDVSAVPDVFTAFRQAIESTGQRARPPLPPPSAWPPPPNDDAAPQEADGWLPVYPYVNHSSSPGLWPHVSLGLDARHALPFGTDRPLPEPWGGEQAALAHLKRYVQRGLPHAYKARRNRLHGVDDSSKWSLWLATGALSPRQAWATIAAFEDEHGANEGTYWLWFELMWRDHFRWLHTKYGRRLYRAAGLRAQAPLVRADTAAFQGWTQGQTGVPLVDAAMRELSATGYLSNRARQIAASFWLHDLGGDWRQGAAWFEHHLLDYDPCSNTGNWLYIAGLGTDPRGGRRFDPAKQTREHDADGAYRRRWLGNATA